ncbi:unnamed protein product [Protopolystoma xenopodis]|uniref:Uncharacterized protein n=1 Tax=Protopolystoma xenopodis TaxID=117903 RepID=A0A3S5A7A9_9PLAT|nr:unnamed protein product [Protopolystoma xenopodis]
MTPGRNTVYFIDPVTRPVHDAWVKQLSDIDRMQRQFLQALQDPTRFVTSTAGSEDDSPLETARHLDECYGM